MANYFPLLPSSQSPEEKWERVNAWLKTLFPNDQVPPFERNETTRDKLFSIYQWQQLVLAKQQLIAKSAIRHNQEYQLEVKRMDDFFHAVELKPEWISSDSKVTLEMLAELAETLNLGDVENSSFQQALVEENIKRHSLYRQKKQLDKEVDRVRSQYETLELLERRISKDHEKFQQSKKERIVKARDWARNTATISEKKGDYESRCHQLQNRWTSSDAYQNKSTLPDIEKCVCEVEEMMNMLKVRESKLQSFQELPPDVTLAQLKIEEAKRELRYLEHKKDSLLYRMAENI